MPDPVAREVSYELGYADGLHQFRNPLERLRALADGAATISTLEEIAAVVSEAHGILDDAPAPAPVGETRGGELAEIARRFAMPRASRREPGEGAPEADRMWVEVSVGDWMELCAALGFGQTDPTTFPPTARPSQSFLDKLVDIEARAAASSPPSEDGGPAPSGSERVLADALEQIARGEVPETDGPNMIHVTPTIAAYAQDALDAASIAPSSSSGESGGEARKLLDEREGLLNGLDLLLAEFARTGTVDDERSQQTVVNAVGWFEQAAGRRHEFHDVLIDGATYEESEANRV